MEKNNKKKFKGIFLVFFVLTLLLDQLSKRYVVSNMVLHESRPVIDGIFHITRVHNTGAAFGILKGQTKFLLIIAILMLLFIFIFRKEFIGESKLKATAFALIIGGALGNFIDRYTFGYVIDFFDFRVFPVFNIADSAITIALGLYIIQSIFGKLRHDDY